MTEPRRVPTEVERTAGHVRLDPTAAPNPAPEDALTALSEASGDPEAFRLVYSVLMQRYDDSIRVGHMTKFADEVAAIAVQTLRDAGRLLPPDADPASPPLVAPHPEGTVTQPIPRQQMRELIAVKLCDKASYCNECAIQADAVMELFQGEITESWEVRGTSPEWGDGEWSAYPKGQERALAYVREANAKPGTKATAYRVLELRTAPELVEEPA